MLPPWVNLFILFFTKIEEWTLLWSLFSSVGLLVWLYQVVGWTDGQTDGRGLQEDLVVNKEQQGMGKLIDVFVFN